MCKGTCSFEIACTETSLSTPVAVIAKEEWIYGIQQQTQDNNIRELIDGMAFDENRNFGSFQWSVNL